MFNCLQLKIYKWKLLIFENIFCMLLPLFILSCHMWSSLSVTYDRSVVSLGTPVFSTNKTYCHYITEILLKVAWHTITLTPCNTNSPYSLFKNECDMPWFTDTTWRSLICYKQWQYGQPMYVFNTKQWQYGQPMYVFNTKQWQYGPPMYVFNTKQWQYGQPIPFSLTLICV
jgi:hypothetical protein